MELSVVGHGGTPPFSMTMAKFMERTGIIFRTPIKDESIGNPKSEETPTRWCPSSLAKLVYKYYN